MKKLLCTLLLIVHSSSLFASYKLISQDIDISYEGEKKENVFERNFVSPEDGWLDGTYWLLSNPIGFVPIPFFFGASIFGDGGGLGLVFMKPQDKNYDRINPKTPDLYALVGFKTSEDDWGVVGGYRVLFKNDKIRWTGVIGRANLAIEGFYSWGVFKKRYAPFGFKMQTDLLTQKLQYEISNSKFYLGMSYSIFANRLNFQRDVVNEVYDEIPDDSKIGRLASLTPILTYDSRDSIFTPNNGIYANLYYELYRKALGGNYDFDIVDFVFLSFIPLSHSLVSSFYFNVKRIVSGKNPFYLQPAVNLRGIPLLYYQGDTIISAEEELRWDFYKRFSVVGFGGVGVTSSDGYPRDEGDVVGEYGVGLRYLISKPLKMQGGFDVAWGPSKKPFFYFQFGTAWILRALM